jgi:hypothetical protein
MKDLSIIGFLFLIIIVGIILCNYTILLQNKENFTNNFTDSACCCSSEDIGKCNSWGKTCVCDYFDKQKHFCQSFY